MASEQRCLLPAFKTCWLHKCKGAIDKATDLELIEILCKLFWII